MRFGTFDRDLNGGIFAICLNDTLYIWRDFTSQNKSPRPM